MLSQKNKAERYLNIVGNIILALDVSGKVILLNKKGYEILGYAQSELQGKDWVDTCIVKESRDAMRALFQGWVRGEIDTSEHFENFVVTRTGEEKSIKWCNTLLKDEAGQTVGTLSSGEEITEYQQTEKVLLHSETLNHVLFENSLYGVLFLTFDGKIFAVNNQACCLLGLNRDKIIQASIYDLVAEDEEVKNSIFKELSIRGHAVTELNFKKGNGTTFRYKIEARLFWDTNGNKRISVVLRD